MITRQRTSRRSGLLGAVALVLAGASAAGAQALRPIVFVHGGSGSGAQYESQAMRFASNGYPASHVRVLEYDSLFSIENMAVVHARLDALIADLLAATGADKIDLLGHSLGTAVSQAYLATPARAANVAHYVNIDGAIASAPPGGVPTLAIWGAGSPTRQIVGAQNVYFPNQTHVQVATSAQSFAAQYEFFTGAPPMTTDILSEPRVQLAGRAVIFPQNVGVDAATLEIFEVDGATGSRLHVAPDGTYPLSAPAGAFGPFEAVGGRHYEFVILRAGLRPHHFYTQPVVRSDYLVRLLTVDPAVAPGNVIQAEADSSATTSTFVLTRYREFWGDQGVANDVLTVNGLDIVSPTNSPVAKRVNAMFVFDDDLDGVNDLVAPNSFFFALPFITAMDVFIPGTDPPSTTTHIENVSRDGLRATINVPNWASSLDAISIVLHPHMQPEVLQTPLDKDQLGCQAGTSKALAKFVKTKTNCVQACVSRQRKAGGPFTECSAPYAGKTAECVAGAQGGAEVKARDKIAKACAKECPPCYDDQGNCPNGASFVAGVEDNVDDLGPLVYCLEAASTTPTKAEAKCEDRVAKSLAKFNSKKSQCYDKCVDREFKGKMPAGSCTAGSPSDAETQTCIGKAGNAAATSIDEACTNAGGTPACYPPERDSGAEWAAIVENLVDTRLPLVYCGGATTTTVTLPTTTSSSTSTSTTTATVASTTTTTLYGSPSRAFLAPPLGLLD